VKLIIAITGNIASGKSSLLASFAKKGINTYSCDKIVEKLYLEKKTINLFLKNNLDKYINKNTVDKKLLFNDFFKNKELKITVENIVHPLVIEKLYSIKKKPGIKIVEVPLLFEANLASFFDKIICIYIDKNSQILKVKKKYKINALKALNIINSQINITYKLLNSNFLINNNKNIKNLEKKAHKIHSILKEYPKAKN